MSINSALATRAGEIVVGRALPFSVFGNANKLLLAKGHVVESASMRDSLLTHGISCDAPAQPAAASAAEFSDEAIVGSTFDSLAIWRAEYTKTTNRYRLVLQMSREESSESYTSWLIGVHDGTFVITSPHTPDGVPLEIQHDQLWVFRAFVGTTVLRFHAPIRKVSRAPFDHLHVGSPEKIEKRRVRGAPRAPVCLDATLGAGGGISCVISDLSTTGARLAIRSSVELAKGDRVRVQAAMPLLGRNYSLCGECTVVSNYEALDPRHPDVIFYGLRFGKTSEADELALHGYVHQQLSVAVNALGELMEAAS
jgi:hypothetical protein